MLRLRVPPEGYIYPAADRGLCDLLRKRHRLVQQRTRLYLSMATAVERTSGRRPGGNAKNGNRWLAWAVVWRLVHRQG